MGDWSANSRYEYALADAVRRERWAQYVYRYYWIKPPKWMPHKKSGFSTDNAGQGFQGFWRPTA